jgi:SHS2 domain-containing protein
MPGPRYETFEHIADIGIRAWGRTIEEAFVGGAMAMMGVMFETKGVEADQKVDILCGADDHAVLFVEWLNAILTKRDLEGMVFTRCEVEIRDGPPDGPDGLMLIGKAEGVAFDPRKHDIRTEVKAATYSNLKVEKDEGTGLYVAQCIVDV